MRMHRSLAVSACLAVLGVTGALAAPTAAAACNDSSGTTVCAQGDIRGTHGPPPSRPGFGPVWGTWCNSEFCFGGSGIGISLAP